MTLSKLPLLLVYCFLSTLFLQSCSSYRIATEHDYLTHLTQYEVSKANTITTGADADIFLLATYHFQQVDMKQYPQRDIDSIMNKVLAFRPDMVFVESVPTEAPYKEQFLNAQSRGSYSKIVDSLVQRSGITRQMAKQKAAEGYHKIAQSQSDITTRAELGAALSIGSDEVNARYQWCTCLFDKTTERIGSNEKLRPFLPNNLEATCRTFKSNEIGAFAALIADSLRHARLWLMDDQDERPLNDSLLSAMMNSAVPHLLLRPWLWGTIISLMVSNPGTQVTNALKNGNALTVVNQPSYWRGSETAYYEMSRTDAGEAWHKVWGRRNHAMIGNIIRQVEEYKLTQKKTPRIFILVGASHLAPFIGELQLQHPSYTIRTLDSQR